MWGGKGQRRGVDGEGWEAMGMGRLMVRERGQGMGRDGFQGDGQGDGQAEGDGRRGGRGKPGGTAQLH